jgi:hypothetical protein
MMEAKMTSLSKKRINSQQICSLHLVKVKRLRILSTPEDVEKFAMEIGIAPGIVVGRLHHEGLWEWSKATSSGDAFKS